MPVVFSGKWLVGLLTVPSLEKDTLSRRMTFCATFSLEVNTVWFKHRLRH